MNQKAAEKRTMLSHKERGIRQFNFSQSGRYASLLTAGTLYGTIQPHQQQDENSINI